MNEAMERKLQELLHRQEIVDCLHRYCRGIDRMDRELVLSAYHPDAVDDHGMFVGNREQFWDYVHAHHTTNQVWTMHLVSNIQVEIKGDVAHSECYYVFMGKNRTPPNMISSGRYIDRFERRNGEWKIAARTCLTETRMEATAIESKPPLPEAQDRELIARRDRNDLSYRR